MLLPLQ